MIARKLLPLFDPQKWPHLIHMGYVTELVRRITTWWDVDNPCPEKLEPYRSAVISAAEKEDRDFKISQKSDYTAQIDEADQERDALLGQVLTMVDAFAKMAAMPQKQQAAQKLKAGLDVYKPSAKAALSDETTQIKQWHQAFTADVLQVSAAQELALTDIIAQLAEKNDLVERLMGIRDDERGWKQDIQLKEDRAAVDEAVRDFTQMLNAHVLMANVGSDFDDIVVGLTETQRTYTQRYEDNRRANKRVQVKSDVVGNHTYAVSSGWTWATIAQKNPKALALDPEPSAPGVEPVVVPQRVISLDKEAKKAGGLCVALAGVIVKPTDEVDVTKTYQLVGYGE